MNRSVSIGMLIGMFINMLLSMTGAILAMVFLADAPAVAIVFFVYMIFQLAFFYAENFVIIGRDLMDE